jgi:hypothetical protein
MKVDPSNPTAFGNGKPRPASASQVCVLHIRDDRAVGLEFKGSASTPGDPDTQDKKLEEPEETSKRVFAYELVRRYREAWDDRYTASRGFRNRLIVLIAVVTFAVAVVIAAGSLGMVWLDVAAKPTHAIYAPHVNDFLAMLTIAVLGAIGGLISGASEVIKVGGVYNPFSLPWYLLFFKIPMGALTGLLGVLAIKGDLLPDLQLTMNNWSQVIIWALVFGASQQLITFMVDRRVKALSTSMPQEQVVNK